jgi:hypothetical protein
MSSACSVYTLGENARDHEEVEVIILETSTLKLM